MKTKRCSKCKQQKELAPNDMFGSYINRHGNRTVNSWCKQCRVDSKQRWRRANKDAARAESRLGSYHRRFRRYGLSEADFKVLLEQQGHACAICRRPFRNSRNTHIDHDHVTERVRGLLCAHCNHGIGKFEENVTFMQNAIEYLQATPKPSD